MCQANPAPRCMNDAFKNYQQAQQAMDDALFNQRNSNDPSAMDGVIVKKQTVLATREHQFNVAVTTSYRSSKITLAQDSKGELKVPLTRAERAKHQEIVARGDHLKADEAKWTALRRERFVRAELSKYEEARKKYGEVSTTTAFSNPRLLVDALTILPMLPHNKTGGGRDLTETEVELLTATRAEVDQNEVEDYLPPENVKLSHPVVKKGARKTGLGARIRGEREASTVVKEAEVSRPTLTSDIHRPVKVSAGRELPPLPTLKAGTGAAPRTPKPELERKAIATPPPAFPSRDAVVAPTRHIEDDQSPRAEIPVAVPTLNARPQALKDRTRQPEVQSKTQGSLVKRILGMKG